MSLRKAADFDPLSAATWDQIGFAHLSLGEAEDARQAILRASELAPADAWAWMTLGILLLLENRPAEALAAIEPGARRVLADHR